MVRSRISKHGLVDGHSSIYLCVVLLAIVVKEGYPFDRKDLSNQLKYVFSVIDEENIATMVLNICVRVFFYYLEEQICTLPFLSFYV